ncbi:hypothetical protein PG999_005409 [Apiospora kogelbergensis]|uniref:Co-chaperone HscB C-terminal oligomerisation domain-containing protein n=1 Tax=Apiospora kogelbergensis TaxID=1337665 RepID=A0AAW0R205_9PEZI
MRPSLLPRRRPLERICDACKQQRREASSSSSRPLCRFNKPAPPSPLRNNAPSTPTASSLLSPRRPFSSTRPAPAGEAASRQPEPEQPREQAAVVPPTHYELFPDTLPLGPPPAGPFAVDTATLRREFLRLQAKAHPDMHPQSQKNRAEAASARINEATCWSWRGGGHNAASDEAAKVEDPELLMEVLEAREAIEDAEREEDLVPLRQENARRERGSEEVLARCFKEGDLEGAALEAVKLRYWVNIRESIDGWERGKPVVLEH